MITPVFAAGEVPVEGVDGAALAQSIAGHGHKHALYVDQLDALPAQLKNLVQPGDMIVCMGAGNISAVANDLAEQLAAV